MSNEVIHSGFYVTNGYRTLEFAKGKCKLGSTISCRLHASLSVLDQFYAIKEKRI